MDIKKSVFTNEQELLKALIELHCPDGIELDPMYSKGNFYKEISKPRLKFDISPQTSDTQKGDAQNLPIQNSTIKTMILDPPFCFGIHGKVRENISAKRFTVLQNYNQMRLLYQNILKEAYRILQKNGVLIFKTQDYTDSKSTMTHALVYNWAIETGFYAKDLAILVRPNKIYNPNLVQRHLRKVHTYWWVFVKK